MEIGRWGFKKITHISDRYREFQTFLADVLEGDRGLIAAPLKNAPEEPAFEVDGDLSKLKYIAIGPNRTLSAFGALSPYFEVGFLLRQPKLASAQAKQNELVLQSMFLFGKNFVPPESQAPKVNLKFPKFAADRVYKGRVNAVLSAFQLDSLNGLNSAAAFAFTPEPGTTIILVCNRPQPWQVLAIENAFEAVRAAVKKGSA